LGYLHVVLSFEEFEHSLLSLLSHQTTSATQPVSRRQEGQALMTPSHLMTYIGHVDGRRQPHVLPLSRCLVRCDRYGEERRENCRGHVTEPQHDFCNNNCLLVS